MVVSEIVAATMIAVCGLKKSYRIVLRGERLVRRTIRRPSPIIEGYNYFPRSFLRMVFRAGQTIAMRWEGRAQNAAQRARAARLRAHEARERVGEVSADMRARAGEVRDRVRGGVRKAQDAASAAKQTAHDARERLAAARDSASQLAARARDSLPQRLRSAQPVQKGLADLLEDDEPEKEKSKDGHAHGVHVERSTAKQHSEGTSDFEQTSKKASIRRRL